MDGMHGPTVAHTDSGEPFHPVRGSPNLSPQTREMLTVRREEVQPRRNPDAGAGVIWHGAVRGDAFAWQGNEQMSRIRWKPRFTTMVVKRPEGIITMAQTPVEAQRIIGQVSAQALQDAEYRARLQEDAKGVLAESGLELPGNVNVVVLSQFEDVEASHKDPNTMYLVVGATGDQLSHEELSAVAGGGSCQSTSSTALTIPSCVSSASTASTQCN